MTQEWRCWCQGDHRPGCCVPHDTLPKVPPSQSPSLLTHPPQVKVASPESQICLSTIRSALSHTAGQTMLLQNCCLDFNCSSIKATTELTSYSSLDRKLLGKFPQHFYNEWRLPGRTLGPLCGRKEAVATYWDNLTDHHTFARKSLPVTCTYQVKVLSLRDWQA